MPSSNGPVTVLPAAWAACPGKGADYPALYTDVFGRWPENWLIGCTQATYVGYSAVPEIRSGGASAGAITQTLIYLLEQGRIDGAVVVRQGSPKPWLAEPVICHNPRSDPCCQPERLCAGAGERCTSPNGCF